MQDRQKTSFQYTRQSKSKDKKQKKTPKNSC